SSTLSRRTGSLARQCVRRTCVMPSLLKHLAHIPGTWKKNRFVVDTNDPGLARAWLSREVRAMMVQLAKWRFSVARGGVEVMRDGSPNTAADLIAAVRAAAALAERSLDLVERWEALARNVGGVIAGESASPFPPFEVMVRGME